MSDVRAMFTPAQFDTLEAWIRAVIGSMTRELPPPFAPPEAVNQFIDGDIAEMECYTAVLRDLVSVHVEPPRGPDNANHVKTRCGCADCKNWRVGKYPRVR
ncbi:MAG: hypothetical protein WC130_05670 [Kiritimatiellia bacterium]|jgi:hypothetical protein